LSHQKYNEVKGTIKLTLKHYRLPKSNTVNSQINSGTKIQ